MAGVDLDVTTLECGYCLQKGDILVDPRVLPCTHIHCMSCLNAHYDLRNVVQCAQPACRKVFDVRLDTLPAASNTSRNKYTCDICLKKAIERKAVVYCTTCCQKYCTQHQQSHDDFHEHHPKVGIERYRTEATKLEVRTCVKHTDLPYIRGCVACKALLCAEYMCTSGSCIGGFAHQLVQIDELIMLLSRQIHDLTAKLIDKEGQLADISKYASTILSDYEVATLDMIETLHTARDEQIEAIKIKYNKLEAELVEQRRVTHTEIYKFVEEEVNEALTDLNKHRLRTEAKLINSHQVDVVNEHTQICDEIQQLLEKEMPSLSYEGVKLIKTAETRNIELMIADTCDIRIHKCSSAGELPAPTALRMKREVDAMDGCYSVCSHQGFTYVGRNGAVDRADEVEYSLTLFELLDGFSDSVCAHTNKLYLLVDGPPYRVNVLGLNGAPITSWEHPDSADECGNCLTVVWNKVVVPDRSNKQLTLYSLNGQVIKRVDCPLLTPDSPVSICAVDKKSVVVSSARTSNVFRVNIQTGKVMWSCNYVANPGGVACFNEEFVLVALQTSSKTEVFILDATTGEYLDKLVDPQERRESRMNDLCVAGNTLIVPRYDEDKMLYYELLS